MKTETSVLSGGKGSRGKPALFIGMSGDSPRAAPMRIRLGGVDQIELARGSKREATRVEQEGAVVMKLRIDDPHMSGSHGRLTRLAGAWVIEDLESKNGIFVNGVRVERHSLVDEDVILVGHTVLLFRSSATEAHLDKTVHPSLGTMSWELAERFEDLASAAASVVPIEVTGETGTGKELVARAVHDLSKRSGNFVAVNCGAIPAALVEGELFGHRRGAYTGATDDRIGLVRSADQGTLFLDEVTELPSATQVALLRVLQESEVLPIGSDRSVKLDLRIITASNKRLDDEVKAGRFRADLRARLLGFELDLPPLRARREDIGLIIATLLGRLAPGRDIKFSADVVMALYSYRWPLNIRELEHSLAVALSIAQGRIELKHMTALRAPELSEDDDTLRASLSDALERHGGNIAAVARELSKDRTQIRRWMKRFGLDKDR